MQETSCIRDQDRLDLYMKKQNRRRERSYKQTVTPQFAGALATGTNWSEERGYWQALSGGIDRCRRNAHQTQTSDSIVRAVLSMVRGRQDSCIDRKSTRLNSSR